MKKIWAIAMRDLYSTLTNRNLLLIMFVTPVILATIIGLAFGELGSGGGGIAQIPVAVVNLDEGMNFSAPLGSAAPGSDIDATGFAFGTILHDILAGVQDEAPTDSDADSEEGDGAFVLPPCQLTVEGASAEPLFAGTLEELLAVTPLDQADAARAAVDRGEYAAAVIIPVGFSQSLVPAFDFGQGAVTAIDSSTGQVEVYGDRGQPILAAIVNAIVEGIVNQFARSSIALGALADAVLEQAQIELLGESLLDTVEGLDPEDIPAASAPWSSWQLFLQPLARLSPWFASLLQADNTTIENLSCLFSADLNSVTIVQQPLGSEERGQFGWVMVNAGAAQAVFFALFTGVFGIASIYDERRHWTLQRLLVTPMPRWYLLAGKLFGNVIVVTAQIALLLLAMTVVASIVMGTASFIWGAHITRLMLLVLALGVCVSGIGVLVVGLARSEEQISIFGPMINMALGALGGAFGFALPVAVSQFSLIYWGVDGLRRLASGQGDIGLHLLVLIGQGVLFFTIGAWFYRRRLAL